MNMRVSIRALYMYCIKRRVLIRAWGRLRGPRGGRAPEPQWVTLAAARGACRGAWGWGWESAVSLSSERSAPRRAPQGNGQGNIMPL